MPEKDVVFAKISAVKACIAQIMRVTSGDPSKLADTVVQDVFVLNVQRAAQLCIDMANVLIAERGLRLPASYKEAFQTLAEAGLIHMSTAEKMGKMAGFRNIAVHEYQDLDLAVLGAILRDHLSDFEEFYSQVFALY